MSGLPSNMYDFSKLCRACLTTMDSFNYTLFVNVSANDYSFCTSVEVIYYFSVLINFYKL